MTKVRVVCAHDCPDMCSLVAEVEEGRLVPPPGRPRGGLHGRIRLRQGEPGHGDAAFARPPAHPAAPHRAEGQRPVRANHLGCCARRDHRPLEGDHRGERGGSDPRLRLFRASGAHKSAAGVGAVPCAGDLAAAGRHGLRHLLRDRLGHDLRPGRRHRPRKRGPFRPGDRLGLRPDGGERPFLGAAGQGAEDRREAGGDRPAAQPPAARADWHLPIRIGTDAALACGIAHILLRDGLLDRDYVAANTLGFERWAAEVLPNFPPARVAEITGLAVDDVERLAAMYGAAKRSLIRLGEGMTRLAKGGQALRAVATLPALTGAYGRGGRGAAARRRVDGFPVRLRRQALRPAAARMVNHLALGEALEEMRGSRQSGSLFIAANNPAVTNPDVNRLRRALAREDLFTVVHDPFLTDTARFADIVLPATTYLETEDFYRSYGSYRMQWGPGAVAAQHQAMSNFHLAQALGQRMGLTDPAFSMAPRDIVPHFFRGATGIIAGVRSRPRLRRPREGVAAGGPATPHAVRQAGDLLGNPREAGRAAHAGVGGRPSRGRRRRPLAAAAADRARLFPGAHRLCGLTLPPQARRGALRHPASGGCAPARPVGRRRRAAVRRPGRGRG